MTIYEQLKTIMEGRDGEVVSSAFLKNEMKKRYGVNPNSVIPSDFCYNRTNDGIKFKTGKWIFEYVNRNEYKYLGEKYPYTGKIKHKPQGKGKNEVEVGEWQKGHYKFFKDRL